VRAVVAAHDGEDQAKFLQVGSDGSTVSAEKAALGSGSDVALGRLENEDVGPDLSDAANVARDAVEAAQGRDPETGGDIETVELPNSDDSPNR